MTGWLAGETLSADVDTQEGRARFARFVPGKEGRAKCFHEDTQYKAPRRIQRWQLSGSSSNENEHESAYCWYGGSVGVAGMWCMRARVTPEMS
jgi:hypothetical protein